MLAPFPRPSQGTPVAPPSGYLCRHQGGAATQQKGEYKIRPYLTLPEPLPTTDKLAHGLEYLGLGWLWVRALRIQWPGWPVGAVLLSTLIFAGLHGLSDEWHQLFVHRRVADPYDALVDVCGGILGGLVYLLWS